MLFILVLASLAQPPAHRPAPGANAPDACALLADVDVSHVLGADVTERNAAGHQARGLLLSQCFLSTDTPQSVSIAVAGNATSRGRTVTPRAFWLDHFHARDQHEPDEEGQARPIGGVGEEAYWSGTRVAGALYVLRGDTFIRISVGGIRDEKERIEKSRKLALAALARMK